jgi:hypothetical protein
MTDFGGFRRMNWLVAAALAALPLLALLATGPAAAGERRLLVPQQSPGGPFYARLERGIVYDTGEWVIIAFYRDLACVPEDFNLLDFFDAPQAFGCELEYHGFEVYPNAAGSPPIQTKTFGNGELPVLFVSTADYASAAADDVVTLPELLALGSLRNGEATFFEETLHPLGVAKQTMTETVAKGVLYEGGSFAYHVTEVKSTLREIRLEFR